MYVFVFFFYLLEELNFIDLEVDQEVVESIVEVFERLQLKVYFGFYIVGVILLLYFQKCIIVDGIKVFGFQGVEEFIG